MVVRNDVKVSAVQIRWKLSMRTDNGETLFFRHGVVAFRLCERATRMRTNVLSKPRFPLCQHCTEANSTRIRVDLRVDTRIEVLKNRR